MIRKYGIDFFENLKKEPYNFTDKEIHKIREFGPKAFEKELIKENIAKEELKLKKIEDKLKMLTESLIKSNHVQDELDEEIKNSQN